MLTRAKLIFHPPDYEFLDAVFRLTATTEMDRVVKYARPVLCFPWSCVILLWHAFDSPCLLW